MTIRSLYEIQQAIDAFDETPENYYIGDNPEAQAARQILLDELEDWHRRYNNGEDVKKGY